MGSRTWSRPGNVTDLSRLPCPSCGDLDHVRTVYAKGMQAAVTCQRCRVAGPWRPLTFQAVASWNALCRRDSA